MGSSTRRICFVNTVPRAYRFFLKPQMEFLSAQGYDVSFASSYDAVVAGELQGKYTYHVVPMRRGIDPFRIPFLVGRFVQLFREQHFDIVQYSGPNASFYASLAAAVTGVPVRIYGQWGIRYVGFHGPSRSLFRSLERVTCALSTVVEPDSRGNLAFAVAERLYKRQKGRVIWNGSASGVDFVRFDVRQKPVWREQCRRECKIPADARVVGFVGALRRDKGTEELYRAFQQLTPRDSGIWLLLVGDKDLYETVDIDLRRWAAACPRIVYQPPTQDIPRFLAAMDLFVCPSHREGFGSVVIEAQSMALPVLVSDIPGPRDAIIEGETGQLFPVGDVQRLVERITSLLANPLSLAAMSAAGVGFARTRFEQGQLMRRFYEDKEALLLASTRRKG